MTEQDAKFLCKWAIENGQRQLTPAEKELLKKGIDDAKLSRLSCGGAGGNGYQLEHVGETVCHKDRKEKRAIIAHFSPQTAFEVKQRTEPFDSVLYAYFSFLPSSKALPTFSPRTR